MPIVLVLCTVLVMAGIVALVIAYLPTYERIRVAREKAGGDKLTTDVKALTTRVENIEKYMAGEDVYGKEK